MVPLHMFLIPAVWLVASELQHSSDPRRERGKKGGDKREDKRETVREVEGKRIKERRWKQCQVIPWIE